MRRARRHSPQDISDAMRSVREGVRGGLSLGQAISRAAAVDGSPLATLGPQLVSGRPVARVLREAAVASPDADLAAAMLVLAVQAQAGGDPSPALLAAEERMRERAAAEREASSLTAQARMSARAMLLLSPSFLALMALLDPASVRDGLRGPGLVALIAGLCLQALGGVWISKLVRGPLREPGRMSRLPILRALAAIVGGRKRSTVPVEVAHTADVCALVLGSGVAPVRALELVAPIAPGTVGEALRRAVAETRAGASRSDALRRASEEVGDPQMTRFVDAFASADRLGVPLAPTLRALGDDLRRDHAAAVISDVRAASVKVLLPLGLLILPAFVLACLVPLVLGGLDRLQP
ncbi:MAG TPA: type II secretion system F family protein [Actinomycetota bacterium]|nr:type II secretion system F family protein [Actinomycetota bacterium]